MASNINVYESKVTVTSMLAKPDLLDNASLEVTSILPDWVLRY